MKKKITKLLIGAFAFTMAVFQPASAFPDGSALNTVVTAEAATVRPGKVKLKSIKAVTNNKIQINWNKTSGATHYRIYYKKYGARKWTFLRAVNANVTSYTHTSSAKYPIKCGQKYTYTVRAYNSRTKKWGSYDTRGLTARTVPTTVSLKSIKTNSNKTNVQISWNRAYGGNYYRVYRKTPGSGWNLIATVKSNVFSYTDKNPVKGQKNIYTVRMYNSAMKVAGGYNTNGVSVTIPEKEPEATPAPKPEEPEMNLDEMAQEIIRLVNEERTKRGLTWLQREWVLDDLAMIRAKHFPTTELLKIHENLYVNTDITSPENIVNNWMSISEYRDAILNPDFANTGIAICQADDGKICCVQLFRNSGFIMNSICHITLNANGGTCKVDSCAVLYGFNVEQSELPTPIREGYTFKGWALPESDNPFISFIPIFKEHILYAIWEPNS